jgi:hypothetical protein
MHLSPVQGMHGVHGIAYSRSSGAVPRWGIISEIRMWQHLSVIVSQLVKVK